MLIVLSDRNKCKYVLNTDAIVGITQSNGSICCYGINSYVETVDGQTFEAAQTLDEIMLMIDANPQAAEVQEQSKKESVADWSQRSTEEEMNAANWRFVRNGLLRARDELEKRGCKQSWIDTYISIAEQESAIPNASHKILEDAKNAARYNAIRQYAEEWAIEFTGSDDLMAGTGNELDSIADHLILIAENKL